jgi:hypothetical protein
MSPEFFSVHFTLESNDANRVMKKIISIAGFHKWGYLARKASPRMEKRMRLT